MFYNSRVSNFIMHLVVPKVTEDDAIDVSWSRVSPNLNLRCTFHLILHTVEADYDFH